MTHAPLIVQPFIDFSVSKGIPFIKMNGLGNDFAIFDGRINPIVPAKMAIQELCHRYTGIGCDQLIVIESPTSLGDIRMRIFNADGGEVEACGNATRCVAFWYCSQTKTRPDTRHCVIETAGGILECDIEASNFVRVDMGQVKLDWRDIPLAQAMATDCVPIEVGPFKFGVAVNVGNPHIVFIHDQIIQNDQLSIWGPMVERHPLFPRRTNVEFIHIIDRHTIQMRVWERGVGISAACGTGACAAAVAACRLKHTERKVRVMMDGGPLDIEWLKDNHVLMSGDVAINFMGMIPPDLVQHYFDRSIES